MMMHGIVMDRTLLPHLYVLVSESTGHFPANIIMNLPNIKAFASKSANMMKRDLKVSLEQTMWLYILILVDSWTVKKYD
ncbi:hypothetical protein C0J52_12318 [Blattella germanica]|nr:hypothetical protein C0J52_12318 [Blattella germanica]